MIPLEEATAYVLERVAPVEAVAMTAAAALGCVVVDPVVAPEPVPPFENSAMDGYAVRAADTAGAPVELPVVGTLAAGADPAAFTVAAGTAVRIMTGAAMPAGADAIVIVEQTTPLDDGERVRIDATAAPGDHVRAPGTDIATGATVLAPGTVLRAAHLGVLASIGVQSVTVHRRPRVGVLSTGDELVGDGGPLRAGQIRDSNRAALAPLVTDAGCDLVDLGLVRDDRGAITEAIERAGRECDALLTSGGVSMGDFDYVKVVLDRLSSGSMRWMQVAIKPAKPLAFGTVDGKPIFGLPGNPVSSMVSFELFARPGLRKMMGFPVLERPRTLAVADEPLRRTPDGKVTFARVFASMGDDGRFHVRSSGGQASNLLRAMALANALAIVPDGDGIEAGADVETILLG